MASLALYIHIPFCVSICPYCDFDRQASGFDRMDAYVGAVQAEARTYLGLQESVHSIFFGGGTPSLLAPNQVERLLSTMREVFDVLPEAEITLESNPGDANLAKMQGFRAAGVNRLSFGVQSLDDSFLRVLGRRHSADEARQAARWARQAGFAFNLDFMFGLPDQSLRHWEDTLGEALLLEPDHLSCYMLTIDEQVPMGRDVACGRLTLPDDDSLAAMFELTMERLPQAGMEQYEISNWARPGQQSVHNLTYWRDGQWIGLGAGAASSYHGRRWKNAPALERYLGAMELTGAAPRTEDERLDRSTAILDFVTLGLRLREGLDRRQFELRFGATIAETLTPAFQELCDLGVLECDPERVRTVAKHQLLTNEIIVRLCEGLESRSPWPISGGP